MFLKLLNKLEDPERPLLGPYIKALKFWGILLPKKKFKRYFYLLMHLCVTMFTVSEYVDIWFIKNDMNLVMNNAKITLLATMSVCKITTFLYWQKNWISIIDYVNRADLIQRNSKDTVKKNITVKYTKYCRKITYFYWSLMYTTVIIVVFQPIFQYFLSPTYRENVKNGTESYLQVVSSWVPFNKDTIPGYLGASFIQTYAAVYGGGWITSFDGNAIVIMVFFRAELEMLKRDSSRIFEGVKRNSGEAMEKIRECYRRHVELVKYARLFDSCISPIMLLYMLVCSVMLCVTAYQITMQKGVAERFLTTEYLVFGIAQLFIYCWHSNEVLYMSEDLMNGPYHSAWWFHDANIRKDLHILTAQFRTVIVFNAGPFSKLTVPTFINILKGAYSYYTLLSQSQMK